LLTLGGSTAAGSEFENDYNVDFGFFVFVLSSTEGRSEGYIRYSIVHVDWNTIGESGIKQYHVERSIDGKSFSK